MSNASWLWALTALGRMAHAFPEGTALNDTDNQYRAACGRKYRPLTPHVEPYELCQRCRWKIEEQP